MNSTKKGIYEHYKSKRHGNRVYKVYGEVTDVASDTMYVVYRPLYSDFTLMIRPKLMFFEDVKNKEYDYEGPRFWLTQETDKCEPVGICELAQHSETGIWYVLYSNELGIPYLCTPAHIGHFRYHFAQTGLYRDSGTATLGSTRFEYVVCGVATLHTGNGKLAIVHSKFDQSDILLYPLGLLATSAKSKKFDYSISLQRESESELRKWYDVNVSHFEFGIPYVLTTDVPYKVIATPCDARK